MRPSLLLALSALLLIAPLPCSCGQIEKGQNPEAAPWSQRMARSLIQRHPDTLSHAGEPKQDRWTYEQGVVLEALRQLWQVSGDSTYFRYIRKNIDRFVREDGTIRTYEFATFNVDNIPTGRQLLALFNATGDLKYRRAADTLRKQLTYQPRTREGGFWHKQIYPYQMWLDGLYMAEPFYLQYTLAFDSLPAVDDIVNQFRFVWKHTLDSSTGLLYHAWDESRQQRWSDPVTGRSPHFWGRAMGWYSMALVDVLDDLPRDHPGRAQLTTFLRQLSEALLKYRDPLTGTWFQVVDQGTRPGNYLESSSSCMFVYAFAKGARMGYLEPRFFSIARKSFDGIVRTMVTEDPDGRVSLHRACQGAGLGGNPYRDGSYEYYIGEKQRSNDFKAVGPFIMGALQLEQGLPAAKPHGKRD